MFYLDTKFTYIYFYIVSDISIIPANTKKNCHADEPITIYLIKTESC